MAPFTTPLSEALNDLSEKLEKPLKSYQNAEETLYLITLSLDRHMETKLGN